MSDGWWSALGPLVGVVIAGALGIFKDVFLDWRLQSRSRWYSAMRIVCALDLYAEDCLAAARDEGQMEPVPQGWDELTTTVEDPRFPPYATDIDWKSLDPDLVYRALTLPVQIAAAERAVSFMFSEIAGPPDYQEGFEERQYQYAGLGVLARGIADRLRDKYKLPKFEGESPLLGLQGVRSKIEKLRSARLVREALDPFPAN